MPLIMSKIAIFFASKVGKYVFLSGGLVVLIVSFAAHQRNIGYRNAMTDVKEANAHVNKKAQSAASKSSAGSGGVQLEYRD